MTNVDALKALYVALGNSADDVADATTIVDVLNAIAAKYGSSDVATQNAEGIENITAVLSAILAPTLEDVSVTPSTSAQTIDHGTGYDGIGTVSVAAVTAAIDANIVAGNIKDGVTILGVTGTYAGA